MTFTVDLADCLLVIALLAVAFLGLGGYFYVRAVRAELLGRMRRLFRSGPLAARRRHPTEDAFTRWRGDW